MWGGLIRWGERMMFLNIFSSIPLGRWAWAFQAALTGPFKVAENAQQRDDGRKPEPNWTHRAHNFWGIGKNETRIVTPKHNPTAIGYLPFEKSASKQPAFGPDASTMYAAGQALLPGAAYREKSFGLSLWESQGYGISDHRWNPPGQPSTDRVAPLMSGWPRTEASRLHGFSDPTNQHVNQDVWIWDGYPISWFGDFLKPGNPLPEIRVRGGKLCHTGQRHWYGVDSSGAEDGSATPGEWKHPADVRFCRDHIVLKGMGRIRNEQLPLLAPGPFGHKTHSGAGTCTEYIVYCILYVYIIYYIL